MEIYIYINIYIYIHTHTHSCRYALTGTYLPGVCLYLPSFHAQGRVAFLDLF